MRSNVVTDTERMYLVTPESGRALSGFMLPRRPAAQVVLDAEERACLRQCLAGEREVYVDALRGGGLRVLPGAEDFDAAGPDIVAGHRVNARLLAAALDEVGPGAVALVWHGWLDPIMVHALEAPPARRDALVMPIRCCENSPYSMRFDRKCPCRDCVAGRRAGWQ